MDAAIWLMDSVLPLQRAGAGCRRKSSPPPGSWPTGTGWDCCWDRCLHRGGNGCEEPTRPAPVTGEGRVLVDLVVSREHMKLKLEKCIASNADQRCSLCLSVSLSSTGLAGSDASNNPTLFQWAVNPGGQLDLQTATGTGSLADSTLYINPDGSIHFAPTQTFPGTEASLTAGTGINISSGAIAIDPTVVPELTAASNTFTGSITASSFSGAGTGLTGISEGQVTNLTTDLAGAASTAETYANNTFLPLTGGTLSGALNGTTGTFSGNVSAGGMTSPTLSNTGALTVSTGSNGNLTLAPNGTGTVNVNSNATVNGALSLPSVTGAASSASQPLQLAGSDASNNPTLFQWAGQQRRSSRSADRHRRRNRC